MVALLGLCLALAGPLQAGSYQAVGGVPFPGAQSDRGIAVNKNPGSTYYGYLYGTDSGGTYDAGVIPGTGEQAIRIYAPDPMESGTSATAYVDTGSKLSYTANPPGAVLMNVFVGQDDTVWVADFGTRNILTGPPEGSAEGGNLTVQFQATQSPRAVHVTGQLGQAGTRAFVACFGAQSNCEVWEYDGSSWTLVGNLGNLGLSRPFGVTVDSAGNSYWLSSSSSGPPWVKKVKPDLTEDVTWTFTKPAFMGTSWTPGGIAWVTDPDDTANPEYFYISAFFTTSVMRFDASGSYLDGFGNTNGYAAGQQPPAGTWTVLPFSGPGGNNTVWMTADDDRNSYLLVRYPGIYPAAYKVHLQGVPAPPSNLQVSNDIYGQIRLQWDAPAASTDSPTGYSIYRGTSPGSLTQYAASDSYPRWKDSAQGVAAGGPFYYAVRSVNGAGESAATAVVGPISPAASTAPAPGSLNVALSYSEQNAADTVNNPGYATAWGAARQFLDDRAVDYTVVRDSEWPAEEGPGPTIEDDGVAGHSLLILALNRNISSYSAQCIRDYVTFGQGRVLSGYYNTIADHKGGRGTDFRLADVYRANALNVGAGGSPFDSSTTKYAYLRAIAGAPEANALFAGLMGGSDPFNGARQANQICYLLAPYADGTASGAGEWYDVDGATASRPANENVSLTVGYRSSAKQSVQSVLLGANWWGQSTANTTATDGAGTLSADRLLENVLDFLGVSFTPFSGAGQSIGQLKEKDDLSGAVVRSKVVTRTLSPGGLGDIYIQDGDWTGGIKVVNAPVVNEGDLLTISGRISTVNGERQLNAVEVIPEGTASVPAPLFVRGTAVGGAALGSQPGISGGIGVNNVGLLARVVGRLTEYGVDLLGNLYYRLDDGSGIFYGTASVPGVKVLGFAPSANLGDYISAVGIIGAETDGENVVPVIRLRLNEFAEVIYP